ncbi:NUDIX domain-containing protein [Emticicia sp. BO119]|uniref:NUDIX domain-containing protein n=1 Tax=Emticicia sp. BO119 TaxID=2757768 RepID=UPI0015F0662E|nr:NUDIX domain-containing protein [Emticicia sp. BO119]MBA4851003.1 NUDIX domain-containing protein [Emticicia sp. BO119]
MKIRPAVVIIENEKILTMHYRYGGQDVYNLPGGNLEFGESLTLALTRELEEELGITVGIGELTMVGEVHFPDLQKQTIHFVFEGNILAGKPKLNPQHTSALAVRWLNIDELSTVNLYPNITNSLKAYLSGNLSDKYIGKLDQTWF